MREHTVKRVETGLGTEYSVRVAGREVGRVRQGPEGWYASVGMRRLNSAPKATRQRAIEYLLTYPLK